MLCADVSISLPIRLVAPDTLEVDCRLREPHVQRFQRLHEDLRYREVPKPLLIGGNDIPGRFLRVALRDGVLVGARVLLPPFSICEVAQRHFPLPRRVLEPALETPLLL